MALGEHLADHAQGLGRVGRAVRVGGVADRLSQGLHLLVLVQVELDLCRVAEGDEGDAVAARLDVHVGREVLDEVQDVPEVGVADAARRVGEEHDVCAAPAVYN